MGIRIREATSADVNALITLSRKTISDSYSSFLGEKAVAAYIQSGAVDEYVADNIQECAVVEQDGEIVGYSVMLIAFASMYFGIRSYRDNVNDGAITFGKALAIGLLILICSQFFNRGYYSALNINCTNRIRVLFSNY